MMIWIVLTVMAAVASAGLTIPLVRRFDAARALRGSTIEVLRTQLAEVDAQVEAGTVAETEAEGLKTEIKRRILSEGRAVDPDARPLQERLLVPGALGLAVVVALFAAGLYSKLGRPDLAGGPPAAAAASDPGHPQGDVTAMIGQLEAKLKDAPGDPQGWGMLAWSYFQTGRYVDAATAYGRAAALDPANAEFLSAQGESFVQAANGQVEPNAQAAFRKALTIDPADPRARYFLAVAKDQGGDQAGAMDDWIALLKSAPADAQWAPEVRDFIEKTARERGVDVSGRLPPAPAATAAPTSPAPASPGPSSAQVAAAGEMTPAERQAMISNMVEGLAARLKANPRDEDGWIRLMRARMVQGDAAKAAQAYRDAMKAFADTPASQASLRGAAQGLGVPGA